MSRVWVLCAVAAIVTCSAGSARAQRPLPQLTAQWSLPVSQVSRRLPRWDAIDVGLAGTAVTLLWVDAAQTRTFARQGWRGVHESNPILGPRPSVGRINLYTAAATLATLGVGSALPQRERRWWFMAAISLEVYALTGTAQAGASVRLP
jgi:hypothetical protein